MSKILYSYLAGIIDGEGCISIRKKFQYKKYSYYIPMIEVGMTVKSPIELLAKTFGNSVWYEVRHGQHKPVHKWRATGSHLIPILKKLLPYLIVKKEQALLCLELCSYIQTFKGTKKWSPKERVRQNLIREPLFNKMYNLNHI